MLTALHLVPSGTHSVLTYWLQWLESLVWGTCSGSRIWLERTAAALLLLTYLV
ncbi:MAG TPA: hypothetical protein VMV84_00605 [Dehalococcoidales bacterium]|nr:hypothetical protein [Dehalococcoidales bacterium]